MGFGQSHAHSCWREVFCDSCKNIYFIYILHPIINGHFSAIYLPMWHNWRLIAGILQGWWNIGNCFLAYPFATISVMTRLSIYTREWNDTVEITKYVRVQIKALRMWWYNGGGGGYVSGCGGDDGDGDYDDDDNYDNGDILYKVFKDLRLAFLVIRKIISLWCLMKSTVVKCCLMMSVTYIRLVIPVSNWRRLS